MKRPPIERTSAVIKRLFALAIPVSMANIMLPMVSLIDTFIVPKRLMDIGYYLHEATTQFGYLTGMATSFNWITYYFNDGSRSEPRTGCIRSACNGE